MRFRRQEDLLAVDRVSIGVERGELFGLIGANGAGKTTLVRMLCSLVLPTSGTAEVDGFDVITQAAEIRQRIGLVDCQERSFFWRLTGRQNLDFFAALHNLKKKQADQRIDELLELVGLSDHADQRFFGYSTGMRQRLAVARGLLAMPPIIFMDEPTRSLDPVNAQELREFIKKILVQKMGCTVLLVTHRLDEAESLCDRIAIMDHGKILAVGPVSLIKNHINPYLHYDFTVANSSHDHLHKFENIPGVVSFSTAQNGHNRIAMHFVVSDERLSLPLIVQMILESGGCIERVSTRDMSLEDAYINMVKGDQLNE